MPPNTVIWPIQVTPEVDNGPTDPWQHWMGPKELASQRRMIPLNSIAQHSLVQNSSIRRFPWIDLTFGSSHSIQLTIQQAEGWEGVKKRQFLRILRQWEDPHLLLSLKQRLYHSNSLLLNPRETRTKVKIQMTILMEGNKFLVITWKRIRQFILGLRNMNCGDNTLNLQCPLLRQAFRLFLPHLPHLRICFVKIL